jgi:sigma-54 specific flagellar transcriptional regulator A
MLPKGLVKLQEEQRELNPMPQAEQDAEPSAADVLHLFPQEEPGMVPFAEVADSSAEHNHVEDIILLAQGISVLPPDGVSLKERMAQIERAFIEQALDRADGNVSKTARMLNLQRTTLIEKIDKYRLRSA